MIFDDDPASCDVRNHGLLSVGHSPVYVRDSRIALRGELHATRGILTDRTWNLRFATRTARSTECCVCVSALMALNHGKVP